MEYPEMKDRIAHIIRAKNLTAAEFALRLGIQPSIVSHLLAGRNNPSLEFVKKLKETFPEYNLDWLIMGTGPITVSEPFLAPSVAEKPVAPATDVAKQPNESLEGTLFASEVPPTTPTEQYPLPKQGLKRIIMVFDDNTFEVLTPR